MKSAIQISVKRERHRPVVMCPAEGHRNDPQDGTPAIRVVAQVALRGSGLSIPGDIHGRAGQHSEQYDGAVSCPSSLPASWIR